MKTIKDNVNDFFRWVKGTEFVELKHIDVSEDPVRPELDLEWRLFAERKIYGLSYENKIEAIVCVAYTNEVPNTIKELDYMSQVACQDGQSGSIAVAYTVWSRKRGAGREIINKLHEFLSNTRVKTKRLVTLSPLTPVATHFHFKNCAKLLSINSDTQNFEYELNKKDKDE